MSLNEPELMPKRAFPTSAGMDLRAAERIIIPPGERKLVGTGVFLEIPAGYEGQVRPRSGLAAKFGITVLNSPGTVDSEYRGEIKVILYNSSNTSFKLKKYDRLAQLVIVALPQVDVIVGNLSSSSARGCAGFGSTGVK